MKTLQPRPRFQAATRHYHRSRADSPGGWDAWVDPVRKPGSSRRGLWIAATVVAMLMTAAVLLLSGLNLL